MRGLDSLLAHVFSPSVPVLVQPDIARRTHTVSMVRLEGGLACVCHSLESLRQVMRGVSWHDEPEHCRTWSEGCRCDLGEGA